MLKVLFIGDIIGGAGRKAAASVLPELRAKYAPNLVIANAENSAGGFGLTLNVYNELTDKLGIQALTGGNHIWDKKEIFKDIEQMPLLARPLNYPKCEYGSGFILLEIEGMRVAVANVMGRTFIETPLDCPFQAIDNFLRKANADAVIVDIHAEATSEKKAFGFYLDGRASAVLGTHTHVPTADERILSKGTGYITDVGMVGARESNLGMNIESAQKRFLTGIKAKFDVIEDGAVDFNAVYLEIDVKGKCTKIERVSLTI
ncbi:YmdB-like metallophosphoesterase [Candidatus Termititenax dinenymphae]|uniref:YmdB-like metallophosphoesterase n=1 Tax=Candidatus Termititenax dinenymphae TaxID=2218523 RepID=A0A388TL29_9BACT|nr:YmdB-like metallophosphoesterase [Candidatus Termititenax dinenymphae]